MCLWAGSGSLAVHKRGSRGAGRAAAPGLFGDVARGGGGGWRGLGRPQAGPGSKAAGKGPEWGGGEETSRGHREGLREGAGKQERLR